VSLSVHLCRDPAADKLVSVVVQRHDGDGYVSTYPILKYADLAEKCNILCMFDFLLSLLFAHAEYNFVFGNNRFSFTDLYRALIEKFTHQKYSVGLSLGGDADDDDVNGGGAAWAADE
jgi:hypothetical protein